MGKTLEDFAADTRRKPPTGVTCSMGKSLIDKRYELRGLLEAVMNSIRKSLGMRETEIAREPSRLWNPHFYAIFAQVHNTL